MNNKLKEIIFLLKIVLLTIIFNPIYTQENSSNNKYSRESVSLIKSKLVIAKSYLELGKYDESEQNYYDVLSIDKYNTAAKLGLQQVQRYKNNFYRHSKDHTRYKYLNNVKKSWKIHSENSLNYTNDKPLNITNVPEKLHTKQNPSYIMQNIRIPNVNFKSEKFSVVIDYLNEISKNHPFLKSKRLSFVFRNIKDMKDIVVTMNLRNVSLLTFLKQLCYHTDTDYILKNSIVEIYSKFDNSSLDIRSYKLPSYLLDNYFSKFKNPFDNSDVNNEFHETVLVDKQSIKNYLKLYGIQFSSEGSFAYYEPRNSVLMIKNTPEQLKKTEEVVNLIKSNYIYENIAINIKIVSITQNDANAKGVDTLFNYDAFSLNDSRVIAGGGAYSSTSSINQSSPFTYAGTDVGVGLYPISQGLRLDSLVDSNLSGFQTTSSERIPGIFSISSIEPLSFQNVLRALSQKKGFDDMLSTSITLASDAEAITSIVTEFIYPTSFSLIYEPGISNHVFRSDFKKENLGNTLKVSPRLSKDKQIISMYVELYWKEIKGFVNYSPENNSINNMNMPLFNVIHESNNIDVKNGHTIMIGGYLNEIIEKTEDKIPILGSLPVLGNMFKSKVKRSKRKALYIFLTPRVIDPGGTRINISYHNK